MKSRLNKMSKNIHDLSDEEFDDLFRDSAEKSGIGFDPEAWSKMSQKLDAASTPPSSPDKEGNTLKKWRLPAVILLLLLLITGTYFLLRKPAGTGTEAKENSVKQPDSAREKDVATDKVETENREAAKENAILNGKVSTTDILKDTQKTNEVLKSADISLNKEEKVVSSKIKQKQRNATGDFVAKSANQEKNILVENGQKAKSTALSRKAIDSNKGGINKVLAKNKTERKPQPTTVPAGKDGKTEEITENDNQTSADKTDNNSSINTIDREVKTKAQSQNSTPDSAVSIKKMQWPPIYTLSPTKYSFDVDLKLPDVHYERLALIPPHQTVLYYGFKKGLSIRLAISPDFSFIPSNQIFKVGNNWAAILEYRFKNRLSIQTGVIRSMKYYGALPNQYEWNPYWAMPSPLKDIDATCKMLDIPINLRYDLSQRANHRWFVGAGLTSYIMLKEEYRYNYENPADPNIKRTSWEGKTGVYPFSVLNLSMGYEYQLFRHLTFQAEPFYKAPLGKVGYGKVRLATAGVFFSVKYPF